MHMYYLKYVYFVTEFHLYVRYNHLKDTISKVEGELKRLHDPLQLNLPTPDPVKTIKQ